MAEADKTQDLVSGARHRRFHQSAVSPLGLSTGLWLLLLLVGGLLLASPAGGTAGIVFWVYLSACLLLALGAILLLRRTQHKLERLQQSLRAQQASNAPDLEQSTQAQKFEIMAQLSGGVAHDVNNSLQVILAMAELHGEEPQLSQQTRQAFSEIAEVSAEASYTARQLLTLGEQIVLELQVRELSQLIGKMERPLRKFLGPAVELRLELGELVYAEVDATQIRQALLNLVINANHAMPDGGTLTIAVHTEPGRRAVISVEDTGIGMDEGTQARIFDPFYTTKGAGGTGLGLPTVKAICEQLGGKLRLQSQLGEGSTFSIVLPAVLQASDEGVTSEAPTEPLDRVRILLVDADVRVRNVVGQLLRAAGAKVTVAAAGEDVLHLIQRAQFDVLCTDSGMPGMSLKNLSGAFLEYNPEAAVLVCSALASDEILTRSATDPRFAHLAKPFSSKQLVARVLKVLGKDFPSLGPPTGDDQGLTPLGT